MVGVAGGTTGVGVVGGTAGRVVVGGCVAGSQAPTSILRPKNEAKKINFLFIIPLSKI